MQLVPTTVEQRVPVKKLVQVPGFQTVNESYVEYEDREAIREKEVWVKKIVSCTQTHTCNTRRAQEATQIHSAAALTSAIVRACLCAGA